jgi:hypothetical protein
MIGVVVFVVVVLVVFHNELPAMKNRKFLCHVLSLLVSVSVGESVTQHAHSDLTP